MCLYAHFILCSCAVFVLNYLAFHLFNCKITLILIHFLSFILFAFLSYAIRMQVTIWHFYANGCVILSACLAYGNLGSFSNLSWLQWWWQPSLLCASFSTSPTHFLPDFVPLLSSQLIAPLKSKWTVNPVSTRAINRHHEQALSPRLNSEECFCLCCGAAEWTNMPQMTICFLIGSCCE